jgi:hypothetical protein
MRSLIIEFFPKGIAFEIDLSSVVQETVTNSISDGRVADIDMPILWRTLACDDGRTGAIAVFNDFEEVPALTVTKRSQEEVIDDKEFRFSDLGKGFEVRAVSPSLKEQFKEAWCSEIKDWIA